jgi:hypothetical protein
VWLVLLLEMETNRLLNPGAIEWRLGTLQGRSKVKSTRGSSPWKSTYAFVQAYGLCPSLYGSLFQTVEVLLRNGTIAFILHAVSCLPLFHNGIDVERGESESVGPCTFLPLSAFLYTDVLLPLPSLSFVFLPFS